MAKVGRVLIGHRTLPDNTCVSCKSPTKKIDRYTSHTIQNLTVTVTFPGYYCDECKCEFSPDELENEAKIQARNEAKLLTGYH